MYLTAAMWRGGRVLINEQLLLLSGKVKNSKQVQKRHQIWQCKRTAEFVASSVRGFRAYNIIPMGLPTSL